MSRFFLIIQIFHIYRPLVEISNPLVNVHGKTNHRFHILPVL
jgi:hypothetical protein